MDYEEALDTLWTVDKLNEEGLKDYIKILKERITELKLKIIDMEGELQYEPKKKDGKRTDRNNKKEN